MFGGLSKKSLKILDWREQQNLVPLPSYELTFWVDFFNSNTSIANFIS